MWSPNVWLMLSASTLLLTFSISYPLAIANKDIQNQEWFLSNTIAHPPESMIGSLGLSISVCCQWMFLYQRYRFIELKVPRIKLVNWLTYLLGSTSAFGCMCVGAFQFVNAFTIHNVAADVTFIGFNIYLLINTWYIDPRIMIADEKYKRGWFRCLISLVGPICFVSMLAVGTPLGASIFEITLVSGFLVWLLTLIGSFGDTRFEIVLKSSSTLEESFLNKKKRSTEDGLLIE